MRGAGTSIAGNAIGAGHRHRHQPAPQPGAGAEPRGADRPRPAGRGARCAPATRHPGRSAVRPRPVDPHALHGRRDDRQQRLRVAGPGLRPHGRQRRGAHRAAGRRDGGFDKLDQRWSRPADMPWWTSTSGPCAPSSGASADRCRATPSSTCFRRATGASTASSSAPRAPSGWCSTRRSASSRTLRPERWRCWATRRWRMRRTPYPPCWSRPARRRGLVACEGLDQRIAGMVRGHPELPEGGGWLFAEVTGADEAEAESRARAVAATAGVPHRIVTDPLEQLALWRIREDGAGLAARSLTPPGPGGMGGRRGPAGEAGRLPPRLRRTAQGPGSRRCPLRPLR